MKNILQKDLITGYEKSDESRLAKSSTIRENKDETEMDKNAKRRNDYAKLQTTTIDKFQRDKESDRWHAVHKTKK